jgi:DNA polymerase-4
MTATRSILHADMDAFFASVEQLDQPKLRGLPVLVGGVGLRSVVAAASYEARAFGCHSALPMAIAKRRCPKAVIVPPRGSRYREVSRQVFAIFGRFSPLVEPLSIDEAFLDLTGTERLLGPPATVGEHIKQDVRAETGLTVSVGIAHNKFLAKLASDLEKPDGLTIIRPDMLDTWLAKLPVEKLWGVGPATRQKLETLGARTFGDVRALSDDQLRQAFGDFGPHFARLARGLDDRTVTPDSQAKSIGQEQTFAVDITAPDEVRSVMLSQAEQVARRLRQHDLSARTVTVKIRYGNFQTITRSQTLSDPTDSTDDIWQAAGALFDRWSANSFQPVRLIGVTAKDLGQGRQLSLFGQVETNRNRRIDVATDQIVAKYGKHAIQRGPREP